MNELALFAGAGGGILSGVILGWRTVCAVEIEPYAASVLLARQNDGVLAPFPVWDDIRTFDGRQWRGRVDIISGGFPCQDISAAGKGRGIGGERSGLWREMARVISQVLPQYVFVENSPLLIKRGAAVVIGDLAQMGYDAQWFRLSASNLGAPHQRDRFWLVANANRAEWWQDHDARNGTERRIQPERKKAPDRFGKCGEILANIESKRCAETRELRCNESAQWFTGSGEAMADPRSQHEQGQLTGFADAKRWTGSQQRSIGSCGNGIRWWPVEPDVGRVAHGVAARVERLKALGNGQVPRVAARAFELLSK